MMEKVVIPSSWTDFGEPCVRQFESVSDLTKMASTIFGDDYSAMKPDKNHVGFHLVALGDFEHFGLNRNMDGFTKASCIDYHPTFVKCGHVFEHHRNHDPKKAIGSIVKSAYNAPMGRVELFIHMDREKAAEHIEKYEREGELSFSMACHVPFDTCTICGKHRKNRKDPDACDHLKHEFGKTASDGRIVGTLNPNPRWFDISVVRRPADRIAYDLHKVAGVETEDYIKWANELESGLTVPDWCAEQLTGAQKLAHVKAIAEFEGMYRAWETGTVKLASARDSYMMVLKQAGQLTDLSDAHIRELRKHDPASVFSSLANAGVVLSPTSFFKYAFDIGYGDMAGVVPAAITACASVFSDAVKQASCYSLCRIDRYDVAEDAKPLPAVLVRQLKQASAVVGPEMQQRAIYTVPQALLKKAVDKSEAMAFNTQHAANILAEEYGAYKVAAVDAILRNHTSLTDTDSVYAVVAAQNLA